MAAMELNMILLTAPAVAAMGPVAPVVARVVPASVQMGVPADRLARPELQEVMEAAAQAEAGAAVVEVRAAAAAEAALAARVVLAVQLPRAFRV